jgi:hypothetical protein
MSNRCLALAVLCVAVSSQAAIAADSGHGGSVAGADRAEWLLPEGGGPGPVMIVRYGGEPARLDGGVRALDIHALFPAPQSLPGVGPARHLSVATNSIARAR